MSNPNPEPSAGLVRLFDAYMDATKQTPTVVSRQVAGDGSFYARLPSATPSATRSDSGPRRFNSPTQRKAGLIVQRFSDCWPENVAWPAEAPPRPERSPSVQESTPAERHL